MSRKLGFGMAINEAIRIAMETDPDVILMGEDVAGGGNRDGDGLDEVPQVYHRFLISKWRRYNV